MLLGFSDFHIKSECVLLLFYFVSGSFQVETSVFCCVTVFFNGSN